MPIFNMVNYGGGNVKVADKIVSKSEFKKPSENVTFYKYYVQIPIKGIVDFYKIVAIYITNDNAYTPSGAYSYSNPSQRAYILNNGKVIGRWGTKTDSNYTYRYYLPGDLSFDGDVITIDYSSNDGAIGNGDDVYIYIYYIE